MVLETLSGVRARDLLAKYGSPLYVYDRARLQDTIGRITRAIPHPRTRLCFASVTNGNIALLRCFQQAGWGLHANTPGDIYLGLKAGFSPQSIVYSGSNLNREEMQQVLAWGVPLLNLDSLAQVRSCCEVYTALTQNPPHPPAPSPTGGEREPEGSLRNFQFPLALKLGLRLNEPSLTGDSRIGVRPEEFPTAVEIAREAGLKVSGLHFYRGTGTNATEAFTRVIEALFAIGQQLPDWQYLDFGGGFGYPYRRDGAAFNWEEFGEVLGQRLEGRNIDLIIEPGRAAIAGCAVLLATVVSVKWQGEKQIIGTDTTVGNLSVPSVHGGYREIVAPNITSNVEFYHSDVCGNTTYSRDYLGRNCLLPKLEIGDILAILDVGAYGYAMSSHFLHRPRPAEVLIFGSEDTLIRQREDYSVLLANQLNLSIT